jgi:uncharacterized SAM-binding protein YcdF (DUF218 family)
MKRWQAFWLVAVAVFLLFAALSGRFLIVDRPLKSDVIIVLAGETERRPERGLQLLSQGYAQLLLLDVPAETKIYKWSQPELAAKYVAALPQAHSVQICPIYGTSTKVEASDVVRCLQTVGAKSVLLETSDYHTRRVLAIFQREDPNHTYSVAACFDPRLFGVRWWQNREWAKTNFYEWSRLIWWELVDRWR